MKPRREPPAPLPPVPQIGRRPEFDEVWLQSDVGRATAGALNPRREVIAA